MTSMKEPSSSTNSSRIKIPKITYNPRPDEPDFEKLVKEHGYVKARQMLKLSSFQAHQNKIKSSEETLFQSYSVERMRQAVRISSTLGEPSLNANKGAIEKILGITHENKSNKKNLELIKDSNNKRHETEAAIANDISEAMNSSTTSMQHDTDNALYRTLIHENGNFTIAQYSLESLPPLLGHTLFMQTSFLRSICLPGNKLTSLFSMQSSQLASIHFRYISELNLSDNKLFSLPEDIGAMKALKELNISMNQLSTLPRTFVELKCLTKLDLSKNKFSDLDLSLSLLPLEYLNLASNQFVKLPAVIAKMMSLTYLNVTDNMLPHLGFIPNVLGPKGLWQQKIDENTGKKVYYNVITREQYQNITRHDSSLIDNDTALHIFQSKKNIKEYRRRRLWLSICNIPEWESVLDHRSGWIYYRNNVSGTTQWEIPSDIDQLGNLKNLETFIVSNNNIRQLPPSIIKLSKLKKLVLTGNRLVELPQQIQLLSRLEHLQLNKNELKILPSNICQCHELKELHVQANQLIRLPEQLGTLPKLEYLDVAVNRLKQLCFSLGYCETLKNLYVFENPLVDPPVEETSKGINILKWYLKNRFCIEMYNSKPPEMIFHKIGIMNEISIIESDYKAQIRHLIDISEANNGILNLQFMGLKDIPSDITRLMSLRKLLLDYNPSLSFSNGLIEGNYTKSLKTLSLRSCNLDTIPMNITILKKLQVLNCDMNHFEQFPSILLQVNTLQTLDMSKNRIYIIPQTIHQLTSLKSLNLQSNCIESIPEEIGLLENLLALNLSRNRINDIPNKLCSLTKLKRLNLSENNLYSLPKNLRHMNLIEFHLDHNKIEYLIESLFSYELGQSIKIFTCTENNLMDLPNSLYLIDSHSIFSADYNPLLSPPLYLLTEGLITIQKYLKYRQLRTEELETLLLSHQFIFIRSYCKPIASEILDDGLGFLTPDDCIEFDYAVNEYLNGEYYNCPSTANDLVNELVNLRDERENRLYLTILETFLNILKKLVQSNDLIEKKLYSSSVLYTDKRPWGYQGEDCNVYVVSLYAFLRDVNPNPIHRTGRLSIFNLLSKAIPSMPFPFTIELFKDCLRLYVSPYGQISNMEKVIFPSCDCYDERRRRPFSHTICEKPAIVIVQTMYSEDEALFREIEEEEYITHFDEISTDIKAWLKTSEGKQELEKEITRRRSSEFENLHAREELVIAEEEKLKEAQLAVKKWTKRKQLYQAGSSFELHGLYDIKDALKNIALEEERIVRCANRAEALKESVIKLNENIKKELKDRKKNTIDDIFEKYCCLYYQDTIHICRKLCAKKKLRRPWDGEEGDLYDKWLKSYVPNEDDEDISLERGLDLATEALITKRNALEGPEYNWDETDDMSKYYTPLYKKYKSKKK